MNTINLNSAMFMGIKTLKILFLKLNTDGKKSIIFDCFDSTDVDILESFTYTLNLFSNDKYEVFTNRDDFFKAIDKYVGNDKCVICFHEFTNILIGRDGKRKNHHLHRIFKKLSI